MKRIFIIIAALCAVLLYSCDSTHGYRVKGRLEGNASPAGKVYLEYYNDGKQVLDSAEVVDGRFEFTGEVERPFRAALYLDHDGSGFGGYRMPDSFTLYLENKVMRVSGRDSVKNATVKGSVINTDADAWKRIIEPIDKELEELYARWGALTVEERKSQETQERFSEWTKSLSARTKAAALDFIDSNPDSYFALMTLFGTVNGSAPDGQEAEKLLGKFDPALRDSPLGEEYRQKIEKWKRVCIGALAPDFTEPDPDGNPVSLSDFRGTYVLLDFWASWCGPCRAENPHVLRAYNHYKEKGFTVLGVSLDGLDVQKDPKGEWLKAIEDDGLTWAHVSMLKGWDAPSRELYDVSGVPSNFLIGPDGHILERNLRGRALDDALEKYLGN